MWFFSRWLCQLSGTRISLLRVFYVVYVEVAIFLFNFRASFVKIVQGFLIKFEVYGCFILNIKYWSQVLHQPMVTL